MLSLLAVFAVDVPAASAAMQQRIVIGTSVEGRQIVVLHRWRPGATRKVLVIGSIHGPERAGMRVVRLLSERGLPADVDLWLIRTANPDGTAANRRTNAHGVDLNRNFPRRWVAAGAGTEKFSGDAPASEPETRALITFTRRLQPRMTVVFHQPLYGVDVDGAKTMRIVRALSKETGLPLKPFTCGGGCRGTFTMWHNARTAGSATTIEFGHTASSNRIHRVAGAVLRVGSAR